MDGPLVADGETFAVLAVCVANICRSPMTEFLLRRALDDGAPGSRFTVSSAGVKGRDGSPMDERAAAQLRRLGGDPGAFTARSLEAIHIESADLVLTATVELRAEVLRMTPRALHRTFTLLEFAHLVGTVETVAAARGRPSELVVAAATARGTTRHAGYDVPDPFGRGMAYHARVAETINGAVAEIGPAILGKAVRDFVS